jgi:hypothetical protein
MKPVLRADLAVRLTSSKDTPALLSRHRPTSSGPPARELATPEMGRNTVIYRSLAELARRAIA